MTEEINDKALEGESTLDIHSIESYPNIPIKMTKEQFSIFELKRRYEQGQTLKMNPDFQRGKVWNNKQKSELIESILMGIPIPIIYLFEDEQGLKQVVDGRQRLSCIFDFLNEKFALKDLNLLGSEKGNKFSQLAPQLQAKIEDYQILSYTIQHPTPERVKFDIFDRVNRGGTQLNNQEMRNALYLGEATTLLNKLSETESFLLATELSVSAKRMKDKYIILRFIGFYLLRTRQLGELTYKSNIDDFLAEVMKIVNGFNEEQLLEIESIFDLAMRNCHQVLGKSAFRFMSEENRNRRPINMGLFESLSYLLSIQLPDGFDIPSLKNRVTSLKVDMDESKMFTGLIDTQRGVDYRFDKIDIIRNEIVNDS